MARRIDRRCSPGAAENANSPSARWRTGVTTPPAIRRVDNGAIDFGYYAPRAQALRSRFMRVWLRDLLRRLTRLWQRRSKAADLHALDDRALHDIGICRGDIPAIASGLFIQDESRRQRGRVDRAAVQASGSAGGAPCRGLANKGKENMTMTPLDAHHTRQFAENWIDAWNARDLDAVLVHYSDDFEFSSPLISAFAGEGSGRLKGKEAVRTYWQRGLSRLPDLHFELVDVLAGINGLLILYRGHRGLSAEVFEFDATGQVRRGQALYAG